MSALSERDVTVGRVIEIGGVEYYIQSLSLDSHDSVLGATLVSPDTGTSVYISEPELRSVILVDRVKPRRTVSVTVYSWLAAMAIALASFFYFPLFYVAAGMIDILCAYDIYVVFRTGSPKRALIVPAIIIAVMIIAVA